MKYFCFETYDKEWSKTDPSYKEYWLYKEENKIRKWAHFGNWYNKNSPSNNGSIVDERTWYQPERRCWRNAYPKSYKKPKEVAYEDVFQAITK